MAEETSSDTDPDFEPQKRPRSCTWPLPRPESSAGTAEPGGAGIIPEEEEEEEEEDHKPPVTAPARQQQVPPPVPQQPRKSSARRNAWGNYSYADLITQAIHSSTDKRLTLAQIYDWMVWNVPYFKDKGDSNSSAGWKNSIRHNLSLHSRFVRVQNEGPGKSSWWIVNPEGGKGGKAPRRRAVSMDNSNKMVKSARGRAAKKKASLQVAADGSSESSSSLSRWTGSPTSRSSEELDAWTDFRSRTNSNASTLSGRLSPILANPEVDEALDDDPPPSPMLYSSPSSLSPSTGPTELPRLADLAGTMNLNDGLTDDLMDDLLDDISLTAAQSPGRDEGLRGSPVFSFSCSGSSLAIPSGSYGPTSMFSPPSGAGLRQSPMQTIQENKQATFSCGSLFGESPLRDLLGSESHGRSDVLLTQSDPLMSQASTSLSSPNGRLRMMSKQAGPVGQAGPKKAPPCGWRLSAEPDYQSLMKQHLQPSPFRSSSGQLGLNGGVPSGSPDLDLEALGGSLDCDMDVIARNDLMDAEGLEFSFDSHLISTQNANLASGSFSAAKATSAQSWVPG